MDLKKLKITELESCFNLTQKMIDIMVIQAKMNNDNINNKRFDELNRKMDAIKREIIKRLDTIIE